MADDNDKPNEDDKLDDKPDDDKPGELDAMRASLRKANKEAADARAAVKKFEDAGKSEIERLTGERDEHKAAASAAELRAMKAEVALDKGLSRTQAKRLVGSTIDELEADADELIKDLGAGKPDADTTRRPPGQAPRERLRSGGGAEREEPEEMDPRKLAERIRRRS